MCRTLTWGRPLRWGFCPVGTSFRSQSREDWPPDYRMSPDRSRPFVRAPWSRSQSRDPWRQDIVVEKESGKMLVECTFFPWLQKEKCKKCPPKGTFGALLKKKINGNVKVNWPISFKITRNCFACVSVIQGHCHCRLNLQRHFLHSRKLFCHPQPHRYSRHWPLKKSQDP